MRGVRRPSSATTLLFAALALGLAAPASAAPPRPKKPAPSASEAEARAPGEGEGSDEGDSKPEVSDEDRKTAQRAFAEGQRAFKLRDFKHAAESFEAAYKSAPHPDALWNAARSWSRAGERTRAANLYAQYLEEAPPKARDRNSANDALRELATQLARLEIHASDVTAIKLDGAPLARTTVYVTPGTHLLEGLHAGRPVTRSQDVTAGTIVSVALVPPESPSAAAPPRDAAAASAPKPTETSHGLPPGVFIVGTVLTLGAGGALLWSGLDTQHELTIYEQAPTQANLEVGKAKELRTNVLIGVTAGLGALTLLSLAFTEWHRGKSSGEPAVALAVGPGSFTLRGTFGR